MKNIMGDNMKIFYTIFILVLLILAAGCTTESTPTGNVVKNTKNTAKTEKIDLKAETLPWIYVLVGLLVIVAIAVACFMKKK